MPEATLGGSSSTVTILVLGERAQRGEISASLGRMAEFHLTIKEAEADDPEPLVGPVDVVMFIFGKGQVLPPGAREARSAQGSRAMRVALLHDRSSLAVRDALGAGADEVLFLPLDQGDLARGLFKLTGAHKPLESKTSGKIWSVTSVSSGVGVTTIAANSALALAYRMGKKVALVDLDYQSGDLAIALNLEPAHTIAELEGPGARLNSVQVEATLTRHPSGIYLLAAPLRLEDGEQVSAAQVSGILDVMQQMVDYVIIDTGRYINDTALVAWERCDEMLYVIDQSVRAMRGAWRFLDLFARLKIDRLQPKFVLNRWVTRSPIGEKHITDTLGRPLFARIPREEEPLELAAGRGEDLWKAAPKSRLTRSFEALADTLAGSPGASQKRGLLSALFSRNGKTRNTP